MLDNIIRTNDSITRCGGNNLFSCWYPKYALAGMSAARMLAIDECEEWIWHILDCTKDCGFEYISDADKEFLIFNTNDFFADMKALQKIKKITGMILVQMSTHNCHTQLWFARSRNQS